MAKLTSILLLSALLLQLTVAEISFKSNPRTREDVNENIDKGRNGVYFLTESTFDDFINYNDLALVCFYETGDAEPIFSEMLASVARHVQD